MIDARWHCHDDRERFANAVAGEVGRAIESAVATRDACLLALPGGSTPRPIFAVLASADLPWTKVTLVPTDDRLVSDDDPVSNARLLREYLGATGARVCSIASDEPEVEAAGRAADAMLQQLPWPPDLVWLGMGEDGHTASIFAGPDLEDALNAPDPCRAVGVRPDPLPPEAPVPRVSLTKPAVLSARSLLITITGERKKALLEQAIDEGDSSRFPIGRVLADAAQPISIHWCRT